MPRVVIDLYRMKNLYCGLGQFCLHLGRALARASESHIQPVFFLCRSRAHLVQAPRAEYRYSRTWRKELFLANFRPMLHRVLPSRCRDALWHATNQSCAYWPLNPRVPMLLTIHDLNFLREKSPPVIERNLRRLQRLTDRAVAVTAISRFVAGEIRSHLDLHGKPVHVVYNGLILDDHADIPRPDFLDDGPYLFTIGDITPKKNFHVLVDLIRRIPKYRLVIAGNNHAEYAEKIRQLAERLGVGSRVILPGKVSDQVRHWLYKNCDAFVFPSLTEGFGLPVIEAMRFGKPAFLSDRTSLPEIGGPYAFYWHSFSPKHMAKVFHEGMARYQASQDYAGSLQQHARQFCWDKTAREYLALYREIIEGQDSQAFRRAA